MTIFFFFNDTATTEIYPLSLPDALPILGRRHPRQLAGKGAPGHNFARCIISQGDSERIEELGPRAIVRARFVPFRLLVKDRKSTRLNSSHANISYAVFCLKKKNTNV